MKINKKLSIVLITCLSVTFGALAALSIVSLSTSKKYSFVEQLQQSYAHALDTIETTTWSQIHFSLGIPQESCYQTRALFSTNFDTDQTDEGDPLSESTRQIVVEVLRDFDIDPTSIRILSTADSIPAFAIDTVICINESLFRLLSPLAQKFVIAHELQHTIHHDALTRYTLDCIQAESLSDEQLCSVNTLYKFQEYRADIYAALRNRDYAQGYVEFMENTMQDGDNPGVTHPKNSSRYALAHRIRTAFDTNSPLKTPRRIFI